MGRRIDFYDDPDAPAANSLVPSVNVIVVSDPRHVILYTGNDEARQEFSIVLTARPLHGQPRPSRESSEVRWVRVSEVAGYTMDRSMRLRINDYLARKDSPVVI
ncbi:MAG: hydrolase [Actinomycetia bacterium]|jgi:hypothetical protein|nr:hydrolase [Actinomycetes bacterium]